MARWVARFIYENNQSLKANSLEDFEKSFSWYFKKINNDDIASFDKLLSQTTSIIFENYNHIYDFDISDRKKKIFEVISVDAKKFRVTLNEWESTNFLSNRVELFEPKLNLGTWWYNY